MPKQNAQAHGSDRGRWAEQVRSCMGDAAWRASGIVRWVCCLLCKGSVGYPSDMANLRHLYAYLDRAIPADVEQAIMLPFSSLRGLAFDAFAGHLCDRADELPESMRAEYRRRRWIQLAKRGRCSPSEFADGMLSENAQ